MQRFMPWTTWGLGYPPRMRTWIAPCGGPLSACCSLRMRLASVSSICWGLRMVAGSRSWSRRLVLVAPVNPWSAHGKWLAPFLGGRFGSMLFRNTIQGWRGLDAFWLSRMFGDEAKIPPDSLEGYRMPVLKNNAMLHGSRIVRSWTADLAELEG